MTDGAAHWARVQDIFHAALDRPAVGRDDWLRDACGQDVDLLREVRELLRAHETEGLLAVSAARSPRLYGLETDHIGPYSVLRPLGQGGMGTVFLAERKGPDFTQRVALKLLRLDFAVPKLVDRFRTERRILARLEHPGIARLIDAGATPGGQPYFAMEFVEGTDIARYCRERRVTVADRLRLFLQVCEALEYAHQQLVVHRDIKPGNILVTEQGRPKLLDFGIAKLLDPDDPAPGATRTGQWFTPDYASPEQVRGEPVTTLSDVYALGVLLYELLAGVRPFDLHGQSPASVEEIVCHRLPERPGTRAVDPRVRRLIAGDLDTIVLKAMAKDPARRYASVRELADDVRRHLAREPVRARPDRWPYRAGKFAQRHRTAVAAAAVVVLALVGGIAAVVWQATVAAHERDRAEEALAQSQDVAAFLTDLFAAADPTEAGTDTTTARAILRRGVAEVEALASQPLLQARMLDALGMVFVNLGEYDRANEFVTRALDLRRAPPDAPYADLATSLRNTSRTLRALSRYDEAYAHLQDALTILRRAEGDSPAVAETLSELGFLMPYLGRPDESTRYYREALSLNRRALGEDDPAVASSVLLLGLSLRRQGEYAEALELVREAIERRRRVLGPDHADVGTALFHEADIVRDASGDLATAERLYREGLAIRRRAAGDLDLGLIHGLGALAEIVSQQGDHAGAEQLLREALAIRMDRLGPDAPAVGGSLDALGEELARQGRHDEALALRRRGLEIWRRAVGPEHAAVAGSLAGLADLLIAHGDYAEAEQLIREAMTMRARLHGVSHPLVGLGHSALGDVLRRQGRYAEAEEALRRSLEIMRRHQRDEHKDVREAFARLGALYEETGRAEEAARYRALSAAR